MVSDSEGSAELILGQDAQHYRLGTKTTDFLFCGRCETYFAALAELDGRPFFTQNLNAFDDSRLDLKATPISYEGEDAKRRRRAAATNGRRRGWSRVERREGYLASSKGRPLSSKCER